MIEKFNGIFYLAVFIIHFIVFAYYGFRCVFQTKSFLDKYGIDDTGAGMVRFFGSIFLGSVVMAIYVGFITQKLINLDTQTKRRMKEFTLH